MIWQLLHSENAEDYDWDVVTGVSAGAINAALLGVYDSTDGEAGSEWLVEQWLSLDNGSIYKPWADLADKPSIFDNSYGAETFRKFLEPFGEFKRVVSVSAADINEGLPWRMSSLDTPFDDYHLAVTASAAIPLVFPPSHFQGKLLMDGGTIWNTNIEQAVDMCTEFLGYEDAEGDIIVDILITETADNIPEWKKTGNAASNFLRSQDIKASQRGSNVIDS